MNILYITTGLGGGGAETQLVQLALRMRARGHDVRMISLLKPELFQDELERAGISVDSLGMTRGVPNPRMCFKLARLIRRFDPAIVHSHMIHANLLARVARWVRRYPVLICTAHNLHEVADGAPPRPYHFRDFLYRITDRWSDLTTQVCEAGARRYVRIGAVPSGKMRVIYNGADVDLFKPDSAARAAKRKEMGLERNWIWLAAGRFHRQKDYPNLLRAFAACIRKCPEDHLVIAGDGPLRAEMEGLCRHLGIASRVHFLGHRKDVKELMQSADALVLASRFEGLPLVLIEAHACGLPVVATAVGGNAEIVADGETGILCAPRSDSLLAEAMVRLRTQSASDLEAMRTASRARACRQFDLAQIVRQWEGVYYEFSSSDAKKRSAGSS